MPATSEMQLNFFAEPEISAKERKAILSMVDELAGVFTRPIIVMPQYADMPINDDVRTAITVERLKLAKEHQQIATEAEAMWYLSTASLTAPLDSEWTRIYMYLTRNYLILNHKTLPSFLDEEIKLEKYTEEDELRRLREWLYIKSMKALKERRKYAEAKT